MQANLAARFFEMQGKIKGWRKLPVSIQNGTVSITIVGSDRQVVTFKSSDTASDLLQVESNDKQ